MKGRIKITLDNLQLPEDLTKLNKNTYQFIAGILNTSIFLKERKKNCLV